MKHSLTYKASGVDIDEGGKLVELIKPLAKKTERNGVIGSIGGFGALFSARFKGLKDPVLVSSTDGVGTKLKLAFAMDRHDTIGIDLVAMCVNDIIVSGAEPLFFLDYFATGRLDAKKGKAIIKGIAKGCKDAGCALIGGETAEMPGLYSPGEYDLAGFAVGVVERKKIIDGSGVSPGDMVIGLASSGLHSNGFSLARKALETPGLTLDAKPAGFKKDIGTTLLTPTRIYVKTILGLAKKFRLKAIAHITGGGMIENIPRVIPKGLKVEIFKGGWEVPPIFRYIKSIGNIDTDEMMRTFNAGIGMAIVTSPEESASLLMELKALKEKAWVIGRVAERKRGATLEFVETSRC
ncbi:MAG: phosphoribosylformylglycinamidine cyclo-ligase [Deltaproteobacteria bacterium]|nr:phosphoribosylformylglycinamidine cyclo-ligase [Deltaproteobacteria bacterium]